MAERRMLSTRTRALLVLGGLVVLALVVVTGFVVWRYRRELETRRTLLDLARLRDASPRRWTCAGQTALGRPGAWQDGQLAFVFMGAADDPRLYLPNEFVAVGAHSWGLEWAIDAWRRPIRYQAPGPVHRTGWDLWSIGPNGIDESGQGDDIVVGEDGAGESVARVTSR